ncbi:MAG: hypothetical protein LW710_12730 [Burkholderiales bacterium]|jgi:hypothetical protein|uniref:hypothetical protein n=1 Tax=Limnobacter sp. TaxID=2003368 RepID=UPI0039536505|nr:hypothetical protein [Burkholderiales bacterium]
MTPSNFEALQDDVHAVFSALYLIDVDQLTAEERKQHQHALAAAYLAFVNSENARFAQLSTKAKTELAELAGYVKTMRKQLAELETPIKQLSVLGEGVDALARLAKLL